MNCLKINKSKFFKMMTITTNGISKFNRERKFK